MECKVEKNVHCRRLLLFAFNQGCKAEKADNFYSDDFYQRGNENLVERWEEAVINNGEYIIDELVVIFIEPFININLKSRKLVANPKRQEYNCQPNDCNILCKWKHCIYTCTYIYIYMYTYIVMVTLTFAHHDTVSQRAKYVKHSVTTCGSKCN